MSINNPAGLTHEEILALKGESCSSAINSVETSTSFNPAPRISERASKVTRPNVQGSGAYVSRPNVERHLAEHEARKKEEAKAKAAYVSPEQALADQVQYLTRTVKTLQKELKKLVDTNGK